MCNHAMTRLLLVEDHSCFREALAAVLEQALAVRVVAQAGNVAQAKRVIEDQQRQGGIDVALVDLQLPDGSGVDIVHLLTQLPNDRGRLPRVIVLTAASDRLSLARAVEAGAIGIIHKSAPVDDIITSVRRASADEELLTPQEIVELLRLASHYRNEWTTTKHAFEHITFREREVLQALSDGLSDREIANRLSISHETVRTHMVNILRKLNAESRLHALVIAVRHGIVEIVPHERYSR
jgi:DNA-binding NarL/FixJ family response regulator